MKYNVKIKNLTKHGKLYIKSKLNLINARDFLQHNSLLITCTSSIPLTYHEYDSQKIRLEPGPNLSPITGDVYPRSHCKYIFYILLL